jgi:hypothetical protein
MFIVMILIGRVIMYDECEMIVKASVMLSKRFVLDVCCKTCLPDMVFRKRFFCLEQSASK